VIRKLVILFIAIVVVLSLCKYFVSSGKFDKFLEKHRKSGWPPKIEYFFGHIHMLFSDWDKARYRFTRIIELYKESGYPPLAQYFLAKTYDDSNNIFQSKKEYQKLLDLYPDSKYYEISRKRLHHLQHI